MIAFTNRGDEMIREDIMERLVCFSDEEINNLNGFVGIDKSIFISEQSNVVDADKLLKANQQFAVRKHARFCEYPKHRHNYLEFMYVYGGEMVTTEPFSGSSNFVRCRRALLRFSRWLWRLLLVSATSVLLFGLESKPLVQSYLN